MAGSKTSCRTENVIYKAEVKTKNETKTYIGLTSSEIKKECQATIAISSMLKIKIRQNYLNIYGT